MADLSDLSLEQLQKRLDKLNSEWHEVEAAIATKKDAGKKELAKKIRQKITDAGHDVAEIVGLIGLRKRRGSTGSRSYTTWVDPDNSANTYGRGPLPAWLKEKMSAMGVDPQNKEQREAFKQQHLKKLEG